LQLFSLIVKITNKLLFLTTIISGSQTKKIFPYSTLLRSKYNLFGEPDKDRPEKPQVEILETDFGPKFGIFTCFDILFKSPAQDRSEEHTSELQSRFDLVCRLLLEKKKNK